MIDPGSRCLSFWSCQVQSRSPLVSVDVPVNSTLIVHRMSITMGLFLSLFVVRCRDRQLELVNHCLAVSIDIHRHPSRLSLEVVCTTTYVVLRWRSRATTYSISCVYQATVRVINCSLQDSIYITGWCCYLIIRWLLLPVINICVCMFGIHNGAHADIYLNGSHHKYRKHQFMVELLGKSNDNQSTKEFDNTSKIAISSVYP